MFFELFLFFAGALDITEKFPFGFLTFWTFVNSRENFCQEIPTKYFWLPQSFYKEFAKFAEWLNYFFQIFSGNLQNLFAKAWN